MVGVVVHIYLTGCVHIELKAALHAREFFECVLQLLLIKLLITLTRCADHRGHSRHAVLDIHPAGDTEREVAKRAKRRNNIETIVATLQKGDICGVEVTRCIVVAITPDVDTLGQRNRNALLDDEVATLLNQRCKLTESLHNSLESAVDIEVVGSYRGDDRNIGFQAQERAVELVGLNGQAVALTEDHITVKILRDTTQKGVTTHIRSGVEPRNHSRCGGLAVRTSNGHNILTLCKMAQHL